MVRKWIKILELKGQIRRLDKVFCQVMSSPIDEKLKDAKLDLITETMMGLQIKIDELKIKRYDEQK